MSGSHLPKIPENQGLGFDVTAAVPLLERGLARLSQPGKIKHDWPMLGYNPSRTSFRETQGSSSEFKRNQVVASGVVLWSFAANPPADGYSSTSMSSPVVTDGVVYVVSYDGNLYAINEISGEKLWSFSYEGYAEYSSPAVVNGSVYFGAVDGPVYSIDAKTGCQRWRFDIPYGTYSSPIVTDGLLYILSDRSIIALDAISGCEVWDYDTGYFTRGVPAVYEDLLYAGTDIGSFLALDRLTGEVVWKLEMKGNIAYSCAWEGNLYIVSSSIFDNRTNLYAVEASTGRHIWSRQGSAAGSAAAVGDGLLFASVTQGGISAFDAVTGEEHWQFYPGGHIASPVVVDGVIYVSVSEQSAWFYAIDSITGRELWKTPQDRGYLNAKRPAVSNGAIYVASGRIMGSDDTAEWGYLQAISV